MAFPYGYLGFQSVSIELCVVRPPIPRLKINSKAVGFTTFVKIIDELVSIGLQFPEILVWILQNSSREWRGGGWGWLVAAAIKIEGENFKDIN